MPESQMTRIKERGLDYPYFNHADTNFQTTLKSFLKIVTPEV